MNRKPIKQKIKDVYEPINPPELKAPLGILRYNLNFEFEDKYPAKIHPDFVRDMIKLYSKEGYVVWDGCCGSGVVPRIANKMNRKGYGSDVNPKAIELSKKHDEHFQNKYQVCDARNFDVFGSTEVDLILSSLPFGLNIAGDKNNYSTESGDISNSKNYEEFFIQAKQIIQSYYDNLKPNGICILDARDRSKDNKYYDLINYFRNFALDAGFELIARYYYELIPWMQWTAKDKDTKFVKPMPDAMDVIVLKNPSQERLN